MIEHFNKTHFPFIVRSIDNELIVFKLQLDDLEGDIDLKDVWQETIVTIKGNSPEERWEILSHLEFKLPPTY